MGNAEYMGLEIAERDANETSVTWRDCCMPPATACRRNASVAEGHQQGTCVLLDLSVSVASREGKQVKLPSFGSPTFPEGSMAAWRILVAVLHVAAMAIT